MARICRILFGILGVLALVWQGAVNATPPGRSVALEYTLEPIGEVKSGVPVKFSFRYTQGALGKFLKATTVKFTLIGLTGLKDVEFIGSPELEWESALEDRKWDTKIFEFIIPKDTCGFKIILDIENDKGKLEQWPIIRSFVTRNGMTRVFWGDARDVPKNQFELYGWYNGPDWTEKVPVAHAEVIYDSAYVAQKRELPSPDSYTKVTFAPAPPPRDEIEEAETRLWEMEQTPNTDPSLEYLGHFGKWYLRESGEYRFQMILNADSSAPWVGMLNVSDSLKLAPKAERRYSVIVTVFDSAGLLLVKTFSRKIRRFNYIGSFKVFLSRSQIDSLKNHDVSVRELSP